MSRADRAWDAQATLYREQGWTQEKCRDSALRFDTFPKWKKGDPDAYWADFYNCWGCQPGARQRVKTDLVSEQALVTRINRALKRQDQKLHWTARDRYGRRKFFVLNEDYVQIEHIVSLPAKARELGVLGANEVTSHA